MEDASQPARPVTYDNRKQIEKQKFYVTTAIAYLNGPPHVGHAYEFITADIINRYHAIAGRRAHLVTGSDEHGQKIVNTAERLGMSPSSLCDSNVRKFMQLNTDLNLGDHQYIRTTDPEHKAFCQWLWTRVESRGDIYLSAYEGWYNVREEAFVAERDAAAADYKDPETKTPLELRNEEAYFFRMSKYHNEVYKLIKETQFVTPESRRNELISRLEKDKLEDLCVSRQKLQWGIPVPGDSSHVMYVWFDALSNYASAVEYQDDTSPKSSLWPADLHLIGKDIIWFHCVIWPAMLMAAGIPLPARVFGHGFVQSADGSKMSKSLGNVVDPMECLKLVSADTIRYYLCREARFGCDVKFSPESLVDMHNADLASTLGNLVHRAVALCVKTCDSQVPDVPTNSTLVDYPSLFTNLESKMHHLELDEVAILGMTLCRTANKYLTDEAPWKIKENNDAKKSIIRTVMEVVYVAAHVLYPIIPHACDTIFSRFGNERKLLIDLNAELRNLVPGSKVEPGPVLFEQLTSAGFFV